MKNYMIFMRIMQLMTKRTVANTSSTQYGNTSFSTNLNLYDKDTFYAIQWDDNMKSGNCRKSKPIQPTSQRLWDWVKNATYTGRYEFMNIHTWTFQDDDITQIVGVSVLDSNRPIITLLDGMIKQTIFYIDFKDTTPPKESFDVPSICSKDDIRMESFPVYASIFNSFPSKKWIKNTITGNYEDSIHPMVHRTLDKVMQHQN